jgi:hypothetical protein
VLELPQDALPKIKKSLNTHYTQMRYFKVDPNFKSMKLLGAMDLPEETTDVNALSWSSFPVEEQGGWVWHACGDVMDIQFKLNADNTVMRMVNFKDKQVRETGDPTSNMTFFLARPRAGDTDGGGGSLIAPGFDPAPIDRTIRKHKELQQIIGGKKNKFRPTLSDGPVEIRYWSGFKEIMQVDTQYEMFGAEVEITQEWAITRMDAADWVAASDRQSWLPSSFVPPQLEVHNEAKHAGHLLVKAKIQRCRLKIRPSDNMVVVRRKLSFEGDFWEPFELESYPFDVQPLKVVLRSGILKQSECTFEYMPVYAGAYKPPRDTEWWTRSTASGCHFIPEMDDENAEIDEMGEESSDNEEEFDSETESDESDTGSTHSDANLSSGERTLARNNKKKKKPLSAHKMIEPPLSPFPDVSADMPKTPFGVNTEGSAGNELLAAFPGDADPEEKKVGFLDLAGTLHAKVKRRREKRVPAMAARSMSLFDPSGKIELTVEAVVQRYYSVHLIRVVMVMARSARF